MVHCLAVVAIVVLHLLVCLLRALESLLLTVTALVLVDTVPFVFSSFVRSIVVVVAVVVVAVVVVVVVTVVSVFVVSMFST